MEIVYFKKRANELLLQLHVEGVTQTVAQQDEGKHRGQDGEPRERASARGGEHIGPGFRQHIAPGWRGRLDTHPRKLSAASVRMAPPTLMVAYTMIGAIALGMMCRKRIRGSMRPGPGPRRRTRSL